MKRLLWLLISIAISLTLFSGCGDSANITNWEPTTYEVVNNFDGVTMVVKEETISSTGLTVEFKNSSDSEGLFGEYFSLEKRINEGWYQVPRTYDEYLVPDIGYPLTPRGTRELLVDWEWLYGSLDTGEYRIVKDISEVRGPGDSDKYYLAAEFTVH
ncbi:immunoglobulin-like domain-containing protein [Dethiobacter alkaliphilus]|uniref:Bacterial Ig-like domain-containing protein n=1 Tax=Dethiobacter alkaliphilus AHT 1 TaxID=555088 RepID=C0GE16_DETAL|nr:immunoglobulin-like domain-containing protein [Dethiobacter alkaliphilus]EEG78310.1 conserved hypothetical protein [Dethiobacter alkaliphilus AHT 1]